VQQQTRAAVLRSKGGALVAGRSTSGEMLGKDRRSTELAWLHLPDLGCIFAFSFGVELLRISTLNSSGYYVTSFIPEPDHRLAHVMLIVANGLPRFGGRTLITLIHKSLNLTWTGRRALSADARRLGGGLAVAKLLAAAASNQGWAVSIMAGTPLSALKRSVASLVAGHPSGHLRTCGSRI
jgi:hypothetical protein